MTKRYTIELSYRGTAYHGWQIQPNAISVQEVLEKSLSNLLKEEIKVTGAGRTDTGVHASYYVAHFDSNELTDTDTLTYRLNRYLGPAISIFRISSVHESFHARFGAISRTYKYVILGKKQPFLQELGYYMHSQPSLSELNAGAKIIKSTSDFTSFAKLHGNNSSNICRISESIWEEHDHYLVYTIRANRFLRNMVRAVTGTLIDLGLGKITIGEFQSIIESRNNQKASGSAPAKGLYLQDIEYPDAFSLKNSNKKSFLPFSW